MDGSTPNFKTWNILYPVYMNSKKTIAEGRRIPFSKACENPTALEIGDCCGHLKIPFAIEIDKAYQGITANVREEKQLMLRIAELVPRHPGRVKKQEAAASTSNAAAAPSKSGKGGRKKR
ncbi:signal recognition particle 19 kDa protein-like protein [Tanacetum coccineum]|uniref:Signal recognition particle 19 kDa protein-like protein n=1 Tax=Tanacetum coccineum TaxID=301880 RepID=A0ABQ5H507_9ASTR